MAGAARLAGGLLRGGMVLGAGAEMVCGAAAQRQGMLHRAGEAAEGQPGLPASASVASRRGVVGPGLGNPGLGGKGIGAFRLGQLHADLGRRVSTPICCSARLRQWAWTSRPSDAGSMERIMNEIEQRAMNIALTGSSRGGAGDTGPDRHACGLAIAAGAARTSPTQAEGPQPLMSCRPPGRRIGSAGTIGRGVGERQRPGRRARHGQAIRRQPEARGAGAPAPGLHRGRDALVRLGGAAAAPQGRRSRARHRLRPGLVLGPGGRQAAGPAGANPGRPVAGHGRGGDGPVPALPFGSVAGRQADAAALPFDDCSFDAVVAMHMLYHMADPAAGVAEMARVLKPGGVLAVTTNGAGNLRELYELTTVFGGAPSEPMAAIFGFDAAERLMQSQFGNVAWSRHPASLRITDPEDVFLALTSFPPGETASEAQQQAFRAAIDRAFRRRAACWRSGRRWGCSSAGRGLEQGYCHRLVPDRQGLASS